MSRERWSGSVERIRRCFTARGRRAQGLYAIEGERLVRRAVAAGIELEEIVLGAELVRDLENNPSAFGTMIRSAIERGTPLVPAPPAVLERLLEGRNSGQVVALTRIPAPAHLGDILVQQDGNAPLLIAVDIDEPGNVGALVRTALCSGVSLFLAVGATDPFHPKAVRTSMGSLFKLPWAWWENATELSAELARAGVHRVAAVAERGTPLQRARLGPGRVAFCLGNEARGLPSELCEQVDERVTIPMPGGVDSFSVNAAAAILLYEANRRRASSR